MSYDADQFNGAASGTMFSKIAGGILAPAALAVTGLICMILRHAVLPGGRGMRVMLHIHGANAVWIGAALIFAGLFLHVHYVWTVSERLYRVADFAKIVSLGLCLIFFLTALVRLVLF